jgi:hypothetical protein
MVDSMKGIGKKTKCMGMVSSHGMTDEDMKELILMIKKKDRVHLNGQMAESILENGTTENSMEKEFISQRIQKRRKENGRQGRG